MISNKLLSPPSERRLFVHERTSACVYCRRKASRLFTYNTMDPLSLSANIIAVLNAASTTFQASFKHTRSPGSNLSVAKRSKGYMKDLETFLTS